MMSEITVSVIVPVYKIPEPYLRQCLDGLVNQTLKEIEIIMIDDGSPDNCGAICDGYAAKHLNMQVFHIANSGVSAARNIGIMAAKGEWVAFVDPDDWVDANTFKQMAAYAASSTADCIICDCIVEYPHKKVENRFLPHAPMVIHKGTEEQTQLLLQILGKSSIYNPPEIALGVPWSKLYRRNFLLQHHFEFSIHLKRMQDNIFNLYVFEEAKQTDYIGGCYYHYRKTDQSVSARYDPDVVQKFEKIFDETFKYIQLYQKGIRFLQGYYLRIALSFHAYFRFRYFHIKCTMSWAQKKRELSALLNREPYRTALASIQCANLPWSARLFIFFLRHRCFGVLHILVSARMNCKQGRASIFHSVNRHTVNRKETQ